MTSGERRSRSRGALLGLACGDALGAPVEFDSREEIARRYPDGLRDFTAGGWMNVVPGETTDDTRMAVDLARCLAETDPPDMSDLAGRFATWLREQPKDIGITTRYAIERFIAGDTWDVAGQATLDALGARKTASNGSLMRCAPVAIRYADDQDRLRQVSIDSSRVTHAEPRCTWSCVALNQGIAHLLRGGDPDGLVEAAVQRVDQEEVVATVRSAAGRSPADLAGTGYVLNALAVAFSAVATTGSLEDALVAAVMVGGDTDTNAAVTGALAGALYGEDAIPARWLECLHGRDDLTALADQLATLGSTRP